MEAEQTTNPASTPTQDTPAANEATPETVQTQGSTSDTPVEVVANPEPTQLEETAARTQEPASAETQDHAAAPTVKVSDDKSAQLSEWWKNASIEGKEFTTLMEDGTLMLNATPFSEARSIGNLTADNAVAVTKALTDKFPDAVARIKDLGDEFENAEDKLKLTGKVSRTRDYLMNASAIGDFAPLYKQLATWHNTVSEASGNNFKLKQDLVAKAETLADSDNWKETTAAMKSLTDEWKAIGFTDKDRSDELWNSLEAARNKFYERKRAHQESQEKELLQNLDLKMELVDKAENLAASESWKKTSEEFKLLMDQWKETGRTVSDKNELLWQRFITAKNVFFDRKKQHYNTIQAEQEGNYTKKLDIITRAEALSESRDWNATSAAYATLMEEWKSSGRVPNDKADELWERMSQAKDIFFNNKRTHLDTQRVTLDDNMAQKRALIRRAQELQHSTQWREATDEFAELMEEWKKIGAVPREWNEKLWEEFIGARRNFFELKDKDRDRRHGQVVRHQEDRLSQSRQFLKTLQDEIKDDAENFEDWKLSLTNITPGPKAKELKAHLEKLIAGAEPSMKRKHDKIESVKKQVEELEAQATKKQNRNDRPNRETNPKNQQRANNSQDDQAEPASTATTGAPTTEIVAENNQEVLPESSTETSGNGAPAEGTASSEIPSAQPEAVSNNAEQQEVSKEKEIEETQSNQEDRVSESPDEHSV